MDIQLHNVTSSIVLGSSRAERVEQECWFTQWMKPASLCLGSAVEMPWWFWVAISLLSGIGIESRLLAL